MLLKHPVTHCPSDFPLPLTPKKKCNGVCSGERASQVLGLLRPIQRPGYSLLSTVRVHLCYVQNSHHVATISELDFLMLYLLKEG